MDKKKFISAIDKISYVALINATIFIVLMQYSSSSLVLYISMFSYLIAFIFCIAVCVLRIYYSKNKIDEENFILTKKQVFWIIFKTILSFLLFSLSLAIILLW